MILQEQIDLLYENLENKPISYSKEKGLSFDLDKISADFHLLYDSKDLFSVEINGKIQPCVNELLFDTLRGFIWIIRELEAKIQHTRVMFLDGSGYLYITRLDNYDISIQYDDELKYKSEVVIVKLWDWYFCVAQLGYDILNYFENHKNGFKVLAPFVRLKEHLDEIWKLGESLRQSRS